MRVLIVNTSENTGGAAVAANRLTEALNNNGVKAKMLVRDKETDDITVTGLPGSIRNKWNFLWERLVIFIRLHFSRKNLFAIDIANCGTDITQLREFMEADIIHLHWINQGMLSLKGIRKIIQSGKPVVWTMHDMWECTAVCHHAHSCMKYTTACEKCPLMPAATLGDMAKGVFKKKMQMMKSSRIYFVAVSTWLADKARSSTLLRNQPIETIPNSLSLSKFKLLDRNDSRSSLSVTEKYVIAFGAARIDFPVKGFSYLKEALKYLVNEMGYNPDDVHLLIFGAVRDAGTLSGIPVKFTHFGIIKDDHTLSQIYSAANVLVSSSLYETFGQTLIEAQACGCIPVSFNNSGQTDIIRHKKNGYLAEYLSSKDLAAGIAWGFNTDISRRELRNEVLGKYSESTVANKYIKLYDSIMNGKE